MLSTAPAVLKCVRPCDVSIDMHFEATDYLYSVCECMYTLAICAMHPGNWVFRQGRICLCFDALLGLCSCNVLP